MKSLNNVVEALERAALDLSAKMTKLDNLEVASARQERAIEGLREVMLEQAGDIGSIAVEIQRLRELVLEVVPVDRRPTVKLRAVDYPPREASDV